LALRPNRPESREEQLAKRQSAEKGILLREVDDALREEEMRDAIKRWGTTIAVALVLAIVGLGGYLWWDREHKAAAGERSQEMIVALDDVEARKLDAAVVKLGTLAKQSGDGTKAAALIMQGAVAADQGKSAEAKRLFEQVAADESAPQPFRDLATIRAVATAFDAMPPAEVVKRLKPLAEPGKPWSASAGELVGMAYLKQNRRDLAGPLFAAIARDKDAPDSLRNRTRQMAALLGVDAVDDVARAAGTLPGQS
jgi:hypothetical protein